FRLPLPALGDERLGSGKRAGVERRLGRPFSRLCERRHRSLNDHDHHDDQSGQRDQPGKYGPHGYFSSMYDIGCTTSFEQLPWESHSKLINASEVTACRTARMLPFDVVQVFQGMAPPFIQASQWTTGKPP